VIVCDDGWVEGIRLLLFECLIVENRAAHYVIRKRGRFTRWRGLVLREAGWFWLDLVMGFRQGFWFKRIASKDAPNFSQGLLQVRREITFSSTTWHLSTLWSRTTWLPPLGSKRLQDVDRRNGEPE